MIKIEKIEYFLLFISVIGPWFLPSEVSFITAILGLILVFISNGIDKKLILLTIVPLLLVLIGLINSFNNQYYSIFRDIYYYTSPIMMFGFGFVLAKYLSLRKFIKAIITIGVILAFHYLLIFDYGLSSVQEIRQEVGKASFAIILGLSLILISNKKLKLYKRTSKVLLIILFTIVSVLAVSRIFILTFVVFLVVGTGQLRFKKYLALKLILIVLIIGAFSYTINSIDYENRNTFIGLLGTSFEEINPNNYNSLTEINQNWRGYETYRGIISYLDGNIFELIVGQGFGTEADLGVAIQLGDEVYRSIPKFHNAYVGLLLKTGFLGLIIYLFYFIEIIYTNSKYLMHESKEIIFIKNIISSLALIIIITTYFNSGWFNKTNMVPIILSLGYFIGCKKEILKGKL